MSWVEPWAVALVALGGLVVLTGLVVAHRRRGSPRDDLGDDLLMATARRLDI